MTPAEIAAIRLAVPLTQGEMAKILGVSIHAVMKWEAGTRSPFPRHRRALAVLSGRSTASAITRVGGHAWSDAEQDDLERMIGQGESVQRIATYLTAHYKRLRTVRAVSIMAQELGLSVRDGWYSRIEVARRLGVAERTVTQWRRRGLLSAERSVSSHTGQPSHWWRITATDLTAFVASHAGTAFDPSRVRDPELRAQAEAAAATNRRQAS